MSFSKGYTRGQAFLDSMKGKAGHLGGLAFSEFGPGGVAFGEGLGYALDWSAQKLFDLITGKSRYVEGNWYEDVNGKVVPISEEDMIARDKIRNQALQNTKFVQDPRWKNDIKGNSLPLEKLITPLKPIDEVVKGFNINNFDMSTPSILIYNGGKTSNRQLHPSSKQLPNAALPYSSQGFPKR